MIKALMLMFIVLVAASCTTLPVGSTTPICPTVPTPKAQVIDQSCEWAKPILISKSDQLTDETAQEILKHNQKYDAICGTAK